MRTLKIVENDDAGEDASDKYKVEEGRKWDERYNVYVQCTYVIYIKFITC